MQPNCPKLGCAFTEIHLHCFCQMAAAATDASGYMCAEALETLWIR